MKCNTPNPYPSSD
ncbi:hypothetical protein F383_29247 [Gossypium arboreum]|uniref:Uncharacterized protein n=1 Tax=Gossypium arboreum TaxID=29729 RepID=A0A0B0PGM9_GOSAR|nr:hypothetical protein F383_29247 [Gossypium arboreum]